MRLVYVILIILIYSLNSFGQNAEVDNIDIEAIKAEYTRIICTKSELPRTTFISVDTNSILKIIDTNLVKEFPLYDFISLTILDGTTFEYNFGRINIVVASEKKNSKKIRILFPFDFNDKSENFLTIFLNRQYTIDKKTISNSIANIFLKVEHFNELCCDKTIENITFQNCLSDEQTLNNVINFELNCCQGWLPKPDEKRKKQDYFRNTKFVFDKQKLLKIDLNGWKILTNTKLCIE